MAEYIKREDALDTLRYEMSGTGYQSRAISAVKYIPAANVVEIVRCENCTYWHSPKNDDAHYCRHRYGLQGIVAEEDFCPYGRQKDGAKE